MENTVTTVDREFTWDDTIENDGSDFQVLPEGEYDFTVTKFERGRSAGKGKLPPCNMAILTLRVSDGNGSTTITDNLLLHSKAEWKLCQFFRSIGQKKHGEPLRMNWSAVMGATGRCKVIVEPWIGNDGKEHQSNKIDRYIDPDDVPVAPAQPTQKRYW